MWFGGGEGDFFVPTMLAQNQIRKYGYVRMEPPAEILIHEPAESFILDELLPLDLKGIHDLGKSTFHCRRIDCVLGRSSSK
jgi:hypothetical protein